MTDFYSQNRCVCSTRSHGPLLCAFCLSFHFNSLKMIQNDNVDGWCCRLCVRQDGDQYNRQSDAGNITCPLLTICKGDCGGGGTGWHGDHVWHHAGGTIILWKCIIK